MHVPAIRELELVNTRLQRVSASICVLRMLVQVYQAKWGALIYGFHIEGVAFIPTSCMLKQIYFLADI